jgi:hypothetical protein
MVAEDTIITGNASIPVKQSEVFYWIRFLKTVEIHVLLQGENVPCKGYKAGILN